MNERNGCFKAVRYFTKTDLETLLAWWAKNPRARRLSAMRVTRLRDGERFPVVMHYLHNDTTVRSVIVLGIDPLERVTIETPIDFFNSIGSVDLTVETGPGGAA
jgi:hypothetical protein